MSAEAYLGCCQTSKMKLFVKIISNFQPSTISNRALNQLLGQYDWEAVFGKFNSLLLRFIHTWEMCIVECYIYIDYRAAKIKKKFIKLILYATIIKFQCSPSFDSILYFLTV